MTDAEWVELKRLLIAFVDTELDQHAHFVLRTEFGPAFFTVSLAVDPGMEPAYEDVTDRVGRSLDPRHRVGNGEPPV